MLVYFALFAVLLIDSEVKKIMEISKTNYSDTYKDVENNDIDINYYCKSKTCILKCCGFGKVLNNEGVCYNADNVESFNHINSYFIKVDKWKFTSREAKETNRMIYRNFAFVDNDELSEEYEYTSGLKLKQFYISKNGFLQIKVNSTREQWLGAAPLDFCVNTQLSTDINEQEEIRIIVKYAAEHIKRANTELLQYVAGGMLVSLLLLGLIVYRMSFTVIRILGLFLMAFTLSIAAVYVLTAVQIIVLRAGVISSVECRIISPLLYFFLLSSFFWINIISYDTWYLIRNFRKYATKLKKEVDSAKFIRFAGYGWIIPFIVTTGAVVVDVLKLNLVLPIVKPPFESCLVKDKPMMYYTHIPISILMATNCMFFVMNIYNILMLQRAYYNVIDVTAILVKKRRFIHLKLLAIVGVSAALELVPHVPIVLYWSIHANNILHGGALCILSIYEKCTYRVASKSSCNISKSRHNFMDIYRNVARTVTRKSTISTIFMGQKNNDNLQEINSMPLDYAATDEQYDRF